MGTGRKIWSIVYPVLLYFLISLGVSAVIEFGVMFAMGTSVYDVASLTERFPSLMLIITLITYVISLIVFFLMYRREMIMSARKEEPLKAANVALSLVVCLAIALALQLILSVSGIEKIFPGYSELEASVFTGQPLLLLTVTVGIIGPAAEELLFRGVIFNRLERYLNTKAAIFISALIFGAVHLNMVQLIYAFLIGLLFAYFYSKSRNVIVPILAHVAVNMSGVVLMTLGM